MGFCPLIPATFLDCNLLYYDIHLCNLNQRGTGSCKVLKLQFVSSSLKFRVCKSWLYHFFNSHLQTNTCTSKQVLCFHVPALLSRHHSRLPMSMSNPQRDPLRKSFLLSSGLFSPHILIYSLLLCSCNTEGFNPKTSFISTLPL